MDGTGKEKEKTEKAEMEEAMERRETSEADKRDVLRESGEYRYLRELVERYPVLGQVEGDIAAAYQLMKECYQRGGKLLIAGNGGSCADAEHMVGELMKGFVKRRPLPRELGQAMRKLDPERGEVLSGKLQMGLPALALTGHAGLTTAFLNDVDGQLAFAQQVLGYGKSGDVFFGISTSGNAKNVMYAAVTAKSLGLSVIGLTGKDGGSLKGICEAAIVVPERETYKIQELHLPIYHALCLMLEDFFFRQ